MGNSQNTQKTQNAQNQVPKIPSEVPGETGTTTYTNNLEQTSDQQEQDRAYGIHQVRQQNFSVDWTNRKVHYHQHYYYSCQKSYQAIDLRKKDTQLKGQFKAEGSKYIAKVAGKYVHHDMTKKNILTNVNKPQVEGTLTFEKTADGIKITQVKLSQNGANFDTYFTAEKNMKKSIW